MVLLARVLLSASALLRDVNEASEKEGRKLGERAQGCVGLGDLRRSYRRPGFRRLARRSKKTVTRVAEASPRDKPSNG